MKAEEGPHDNSRREERGFGTNARQQSRFRLQLRGKLILAYLLIALLPLVTLTGVVIMLTQNEVTDLIDTTLADQAERISETIGRSIVQLTKDLGGLSVNPSIEQMVVIRPTNIVREKGLEDKTIEEMEAIMDETRNLETNVRTQDFQATVADFGTFSELIVVNLDGMVVVQPQDPIVSYILTNPGFNTPWRTILHQDIQKLPGRKSRELWCHGDQPLLNRQAGGIIRAGALQYLQTVYFPLWIASAMASCSS